MNKKLCVYCGLPLRRYGAKSHLVCHKKAQAQRTHDSQERASKSKVWRRWKRETDAVKARR